MSEKQFDYDEAEMPSIEDVPESLVWHLQRSRGYTCERCYEKRWKKIVHLNGDLRDNDLNNLTLYCKSCYEDTNDEEIIY